MRTVAEDGLPTIFWERVRPRLIQNWAHCRTMAVPLLQWPPSVASRLTAATMPCSCVPGILRRINVASPAFTIPMLILALLNGLRQIFPLALDLTILTTASATRINGDYRIQPPEAGDSQK